MEIEDFDNEYLKSELLSTIGQILKKKDKNLTIIKLSEVTPITINQTRSDISKNWRNKETNKVILTNNNNNNYYNNNYNNNYNKNNTWINRKKK